MRAWLFPGQGSQRAGMGEEVFDLFAEECARVDAVLGYSVRELCLRDPDGLLGRTRFAQPALFVVNALTLLARCREEPRPDYYAGHSLGEFNALHAAGCFDLVTGVRLVQRRGELMDRAGGGGMVAVIGLTAAELAERIADSGADEVDVANHNSARQIVVSGPSDALRTITAALKPTEGVRCVPLRVSTAFHSRRMAAAAEEFADFLGGFAFDPPRTPVVSNVTGLPYQPDEVAELLGRQIAAPVRWWESMSWLIRNGVDEAAEIGPGRVLTGLWREALREPAPPPAAPRSPSPPTAAPQHTGPARTGADSRAPTPTERPADAQRLGSEEMRADYGLRYAYLAGSMYQGIASTDLVVRMARAGLMGFFGVGGLPLERVAQAITEIRDRLGPDGRFGLNLLNDLNDPRREQRSVDLYLREDVRFVEAAAYLGVTEPLVRFRFTGAHRDAAGRPVAVRRVLAKVSRPEVATAFLSPPPAAVLERLVHRGLLTGDEAEAARELPVASELCVEADSGGHTDGGVALTLVPSMLRLRDEVAARHGYTRRIAVGASGGLGAPEAVAAAFALGADFVITGSVNQCTPEAKTSEAVKDLLARLDVQDTAYAPSGDMFEFGARVQVVRKGTLFPARANKLYELYRRHGSLDELDRRTRLELERTVFRRSLEEVWRQTREHYLATGRPGELDKAERDARRRMALTFKWYFARTNRLALAGDPTERANYQIHCGPAMGAFNRFVRGTELADWRRRHVDVVADRLMRGAARVLYGSGR